MSSSLSIFRKVAVAEGISYLLLLFLAMPLKYLAGLPLYVKYTGWAHGLLFVLYAATLILAWQEQKWKFGKAVLIFLASLLPFAPFIVDRKLKDEKALN
jgi:integral membrane protein